jgi:hypothetical protein
LICDNIWGHTYHDEIWQWPYFYPFCVLYRCSDLRVL